MSRLRGPITLERNLGLWRSAEFPGTNGHVSALGMATFYNALAQENCSAASTWRKCGYPRVVSTSTCAWALGSPSTAGVWGTCSTSAASSGQTLKIFGHGRSGGSFAFVDLEHRIGYSYVMNKFDATMAHADPRSIALSYEVYATLGVSANSSGLPEADPWQS